MIEAALHVTVTAAVAIVFFFVRHGFGTWSTALPIALVAVASGRLVALGWRMRAKTARTSGALTQAGVLGAMILGGLVFALPSSAVSAHLPKRAQRYVEVDELVTVDDTSDELIVRGHVKAGSIVLRGNEYRFVLRGGRFEIPVGYRGVVPDTFRDGTEVAVTGHLRRENGELGFDATELSAKCPSRYEGAKPGNTAYH